MFHLLTGDATTRGRTPPSRNATASFAAQLASDASRPGPARSPSGRPRRARAGRALPLPPLSGGVGEVWRCSNLAALHLRLTVMTSAWWVNARCLPPRGARPGLVRSAGLEDAMCQPLLLGGLLVPQTIQQSARSAGATGSGAGPGDGRRGTGRPAGDHAGRGTRRAPEHPRRHQRGRPRCAGRDGRGGGAGRRRGDRPCRCSGRG